LFILLHSRLLECERNPIGWNNWMAATQGTLYWLKAVAGKSTLPAPLGVTARSAMFDFVVYLLYRAGSAVAAALPLPFLFAFGQFIGVCAWAFAGKYRRLATRNLEIAFANEKSPRELRQLVRRHFRRLGANLLCSAKLTQMPPEKILERVEVENIESMAREFRAGVPVALVLSHLGTWEVFAQLMPKFVGFVRNASVYQGLGNRFIDEHVRRTRSQTGLELFDRHDGFEPVIDLLRSGGGVGVLSDQHAGDHGVWTPFFGRLASTSPLPALLAKRTRAALIAAGVYTTGRARWRLVFTERFDETGASVAVLTSKINQVIEEQIRRAPEDWFWVHNRWKTPEPNFLLAHYKRGIYLPPGISASDLKPFRILIRSSNWLGDSVMSVLAVRAIKNGRPDIHVTIAAPNKIAPMWKLIPEVDAIIPLPNDSFLPVVRLLRQQMPFDVAILFPNSLRVALESWFSGIPRRVGYRGHCRSWLVNQVVREPRKPGPPEHHSLRFLRIARECGAETSNPPSQGIEHRTSNIEIPNQTSNIKHQTLIGLCPGAEYGPAKRWLPERFAEAAAKITAQSSAQWILFGTKNDAAIGEQIAAAIGDHCVNRIGQTTLDQLIDELRQCRLLLTNDTGTMHLAALLGLPVVAIFGSTEPRLTGPLGNGHIILRHHVECSPCFLRECPIDFRCMKAVSADEVVGAVLSMLAN
jgi:lipopolysaccharide heptosyltransferase II